ncbi:MAG: hypothetical protein HYS16_00075 [Deltaproteobacteria bacterium]|nr:MAG: hypothetical protein HYS16_00075 [Deltaproteobacteria bacterium]
MINLYPKKKFGQNFLTNNSLLHLISKEIIELSKKNNCNICEFGTGFGNLTKFLLEFKVEIISLERDRELIPHILLLFKSKSFKNFLKVYETDIIHFFKDYFESYQFKTILCGNIPYHLANDILQKIIQFQMFIPGSIFLVPEELAKKLLENNQCNIYNLLKQKYKISILTKIYNNVFYPKPKIVSYLLKFESKF